MKLKDVVADKWEFYRDRIEPLEQGVNIWYRGVPYPLRAYFDNLNDGNHTIRVLEALGKVKKYLFALTFLKDVVIPYRFSIKSYEPFLYHLVLQFEWTLGGMIIKDKEFSVPVWEIGKLLHRFLWEAGLNMDLSARYTRILMMFLEFDLAYRYRLQDLFGEIGQLDRNSLKNLAQVYLKREILHQNEPTWGARGKVTQIIKLLNLMLLVPKFSKALQKAQVGIDFGKIRFNNDDLFHISWWYGYDFQGKSFEARFVPYEEVFKNAPFKKKLDPQVTANFMTGK